MGILDIEKANIVFSHPRHQAAQKLVADLIQQLRDCTNVEDGHTLQQALLDLVVAVEEDRNACSRAVKRFNDGKGPQPGAPDPQSGLDPALPETWELERDVCERISRQYRCVGDALAWRVFGFQRQQIIALCQNAPPGVWAGKQGTASERAVVEEARASGQFALLHDLTNCLRIGDVTVFAPDGDFETIEVKSDPGRRSPKQNRRIKAARAAVKDGGPLSASDPRARLYDLDVEFKTHLDMLQLGTERAASDGLFVAKLPGDRALLVCDLYGCTLKGWSEEEWAERLSRKHTAVLRRAGLGTDRTWNIAATSMDSVSRDPTRVPFAAYPLHPVICARIIGDLSIFFVETSATAMERSVREAGIDARWVRPPGGRELGVGEVLMNMSTKTSSSAPAGLVLEHTRTLQMRRSDLDHYLIEMLDQNTWLEGIRRMLADPRVSGRPWPHLRGEEQVWR